MAADQNKEEQLEVRIIDDIKLVNADDWNACACPNPETFNPFISHSFLAALEVSETVKAETGWHPQHLIFENENGLQAAMPCYLKAHSRGEYVFDNAWADAYERAGGNYYPKLQSAIPFTPVTGPRLLSRPGKDSDANKALLAHAAKQLTHQLGLSSLHITFAEKHDWDLLDEHGYLKRKDLQFHWENNSYEKFDDFLGDLASRKRKTIRKERREALSNSIEIEWLTGEQITESHWDTFFKFYMDTSERKWGMPYLNRKFFSLISASMKERILLIMCKRDDRYIAGALNFIGGDTLFGRYWGAIEDHSCLHFETCYYQAIDFAIEHKLRYVEAGAQGPHKLARGYLPKETYSAHYISSPSLRSAIARFLEQEADFDALQMTALNAHSPYKKPDL